MVENSYSEQNSLYTAAGFYMLRAPVLPTEIFLELTKSANSIHWNQVENIDDELEKINLDCYRLLKQAVSQSAIKQALTAASTDMSEALERIQDEAILNKRTKRVYSSLLRYIIRMSTRPTPFGLFSGVAIGILADQTNVQLSASKIEHIRTRPDMSWLLHIIQKIEGDPKILPQLSVIVNRAVYLTESRIVIPQADVYGQNDDRSITLRLTPVVQYVLEQAQRPIRYQQLLDDLQQKFSQATQNQVEGLLTQLWNHHLLMSNLRPPLTIANPTNFVVEQLEKVPSASYWWEKLTCILEKTSEIDKEIINGSTQQIQELVQQQMTITPEYKSQTYQIDTALNLSSATLNKVIGEAACISAEILLRLGLSSKGPRHLREYHAAFMEQYGLGTEVPLLELLGPETGLDAPPTYQKPAREYQLMPPLPPINTQARDSILGDILAEAWYNQQMEIELTDTLLEKLAQWSPKRGNPPPPSIELYIQLQASSMDDLDNKQWKAVIAPATLAYGGRTFSRFFDILEEKDIERLQQFILQEEALHPEVIFAELSYIPPIGRAANVTTHPRLRSYEIVVNTAPSVPLENVISLDDLVVGVDNDRFYIKSLRLGREVRVCQSHMLSWNQAPNVCRFLLEVAHSNQPMLSSFDWGFARQAPFLPRLVRGNIIFSPASWNLRHSMLSLRITGNEENDTFINLQNWRQQWHVPRFVYLVEFDNRLLLDLQHPMMVSELYKDVKKAGDRSVVLQEMLPDLNNLWLRDQSNRSYVAELVVPMILRTSEEQLTTRQKVAETLVDASAPAKKIITFKDRRKFPGDEWTYIKLYAANKQFNEIITYPLREIVHELTATGLIDRWFFIRYLDPKPHLRVRFHASHTQYKGAVLTKTLAWSKQLREKGLINDVIIVSYEPEIERYGGPDAIEFMEQVFSANSDVSSELIAAQYTKQITLDPMAVAVLLLDQMFFFWGIELIERLKYAKEHTTRERVNDIGNKFHTQKKFFTELLLPWSSDFDKEILSQREFICSVLSAQTSVLQNASRMIHQLKENKILWRPENDILSSLAHMQLNRFLGIDSERELNIYALWCYLLERIQRRPENKA